MSSRRPRAARSGGLSSYPSGGCHGSPSLSERGGRRIQAEDVGCLRALPARPAHSNGCPRDASTPPALRWGQGAVCLMRRCSRPWVSGPRPDGRTAVPEWSLAGGVGRHGRHAMRGTMLAMPAWRDGHQRGMPYLAVLVLMLYLVLDVTAIRAGGVCGRAARECVRLVSDCWQCRSACCCEVGWTAGAQPRWGHRALRALLRTLVLQRRVVCPL